MTPMPYQPALDGLRALSVIAVIFYHAGFSWMHGGFFGVEVFFVVSGFLITSLLIDERVSTRVTNLGQFWLRRARRLLPALAVVLAAVATYALIAGTDEQRSQLRRDLPWSIFYVNNWGQIVGDVPYYTGDPPLLRHLWSLAVEEQWYLLWPLAFVAIAAAKLRPATAAKLLAGIAAAVIVLTFWIHRGGPGPLHSPLGFLDGVDRVNFMYLSTLTRASGLLLGAAAAFVWRPWSWRRFRGETAPNLPWVDGLGAAAVAGLGVIAASAVLVEGYVFQWLLAVVSLLSLVAVAAAVHPGATWFRFVMSWQPLVEIGKRSYGIYLWHWPIFVFADATNGSVRHVVGALMLTGAINEVCYQVVETPVRRGALGRWWKATTTEQRRIPLGVAGAVALVLTVVYSTVGPYNPAAGGDNETFVLPTPAAPAPVGSEPLAVPDSGPPAEPRRLVIVGDSQANALAINLPDGIGDTFTVTNGALDGCSVYDGGRVFSDREGFNNNFAMCEGWADDWASAAAQADAEIALVVLGAWDVFDLETADDERLTFGSDDWDDYVTSSLQEGIDALAATGVDIALLEVACMRPTDVEGAGVPALPERGDDERVAHLNELWRDVAAANADTTTFVDGPDEWCDDEEIATDVGYRWDGVHVYVPGANLIYETIAPTLLTLG